MEESLFQVVGIRRRNEDDALPAQDREPRQRRGAVLLSGVTRDTHSIEDMERIYWGIGCRIGSPVEQSSLGDRLGHVQCACNAVKAGDTPVSSAP